MSARHSSPSEVSLDSLPGPLRALVEAELAPGESIRWIGQPIVARLVWRQSTIPTLFGLFWIPAMLFWMWKMHQDARPTWWLGLPILLLGLALLSWPWWALRRARHTAYLVTDRRALACHAAYPVASHSYPPDFLDTLERRQRRDGSGDLAFAVEAPDGVALGPPRISAGFLALRDVRAVEKLIRDSFESPRG